MKLLLLVVLGVPPLATVAQNQPAGAWLDKASIEWNRPGARLPKAPKDAQRKVTPEYCKAQKHPVTTPEERMVAGAGWEVFASYQSEADVAVVGGALGQDGMCRPDPYQFFAFVRGKYAGILSPRLMRARADGSINKISFAGPKKIVAEFSRYTPADPLCCPSRISEATYEVGRTQRKPLVLVKAVRTRPT